MMNFTGPTLMNLALASGWAAAALGCGDSQRKDPAGSTSPASTLTAPSHTTTTGPGLAGSIPAPPSTAPSDTSGPRPTPTPSSVATNAEDAGAIEEPGPAVEQPAEQSPLGSCTDTPPDDRETCATWAQWGECDAGWLKDPGFCNASCGRCEPGAAPASPGDDEMGGQMAGGMSGAPVLGDDNPYPPINGGEQGVSTRYWDCCKPGCAWPGKGGEPIRSCGGDNESQGSNNNVQSGCEAGGSAFTCHSMSPFAHSSALSFGFAAVNNVSCGSCYQLQFTGSSRSAGNDPGSAAIAGKTLVVMATNTGDIGEHHFDLLIPGGGFGQYNGCTGNGNQLGQKGVQTSEMGANDGGFLAQCRAQTGDHSGYKACVRDKCETVFNARGLTELYEGCVWFVDWFEAADNPDFLYQPVECPTELTSLAR